MYIDCLDFIKGHQTISQQLDVKTLSRANELFDNLHGILDFNLSGEINKQNRPILRLKICGKIMTSCQNCLEEVEIPLDCDVVIPVFYNERELNFALQDQDSGDYSGIVAEAHFDVLNFVEDEIIMLLPIAPKHEECTLA